MTHVTHSCGDADDRRTMYRTEGSPPGPLTRNSRPARAIYLLLPSQSDASLQELSPEALDAVVGGLSAGVIFTAPFTERGNTNSLLATSYEP